jgi:hypothetical protein
MQHTAGNLGVDLLLIDTGKRYFASGQFPTFFPLDVDKSQ